MIKSIQHSSHTFHIPVMGTGFTIDTPLRIAEYGISSVISLVDDILIEQMRKFHCEKADQPYEETPAGDDDARALRITAYLNLMDYLIANRVKALQASPFEPGSKITRYFELLPDSPPKRAYHDMLTTTDPQEKERLQESLRSQAVPGSIEANIMTKLDRDKYRNGEKMGPEFADAMSALRGYANSTLNSSLVLSAGMNPRLYSYLTTFDDFFPDENGRIKKRITLKVSDYRSAIIQGKFLAKRGIWVSEYRIESGLNCGGHAFATKGELMGPILKECRLKRNELTEKLHPIYVKALKAANRTTVERPLDVKVTVQGGIGTAEEAQFLLQHYNVDSTGWCTPFMLVPEVANVDEEHLKKLAAATDKDVRLTDGSPLSILYWNLLNSSSEMARTSRIRDGRPGAPCPKKHAVTNTEFTKIPICTASRAYQKLKLEHLPSEGFSDSQLAVVKEDILARACICHELGGSVKIMHGIEPTATSTICCGPGITDFSKVASLEDMAGHIYGRLSLMTNPERPHMFIRELKLYIDNFRRETERYSLELSARAPKYFNEVRDNLLEGIEYYRRLAGDFTEETRIKFLNDLETLRNELEGIPIPTKDM
ncbi:MAG: hypothetical protein KAJ46_01405 [Sedimentisphaerales bacterium]|nr:hypothetical protein [Sedimentisphaerales bacterium]